MRAFFVFASAFVVALPFACSSPPPPPPPEDSAPPIVCCKPSSIPECCMQLGGTQFGSSCPALTCEISDPSSPAWNLSTDSNGCAIWIVPPGPFACGPPPTPPIEAGPPCAPESVANYVPAPLVPPKNAAGACTSQELADFYVACIASGTASTACEALQNSEAGACSACLLSASTDATWGAVVTSPAHTKMNVAGCIALVQNDDTAGSCADRVSAELGCEAFACDSVCPVTLDGGATSYAQCTQEIAAGACLPYLDAECDPGDAGITACFTHVTNAASFASFASLFCGGS